MRIRELGLDPRIVGALEAEGYDVLWPSQEEGAKAAAAGENLVLAVPTASGKSLVAYIALLARAFEGGKGIYLVPLRALAAEKHEDLERLGRRLGLHVALAMGDLDAADPQLSQFDIIVATSEKADALLRHRAHWLAQMAAIVADEVHLLHDAGRGPTLEVLLTRFRQLAPEAQLVALSATVGNSREVARWLGARHVTTDWRPVKLREGVLHNRVVFFTDNSKEPVRSRNADPVLALAQDTVEGGGQALVFVNNRKSTEAVAEKLGKVLAGSLATEERKALADAAATLRGGEEETSVQKRLARCLEGGAAFHHAGLRNDERRIVERLFKEGRLKALAATPTLAAGINLPARRVVIRDLGRYDATIGMNVALPVLEYKQMAGRAGRPKYDKEGEAIVLAKTVEERTEAIARYLLADPEDVISKLGSESALRVHLLASVAAGFAHSEDDLKDFMRHTFYAEQSDVFRLDQIVADVLAYLVRHKFLLAKDGRLAATRLGKRVSELYIDPESAVRLIEALAAARKRGTVPVLGALHAIAACPDMLTTAPRRGEDWLEAASVERYAELLLPPQAGGLDYELFLGQLKTALLLEDWIEEKREEHLVEKYSVYPGDIRIRVDAAEWLLHALYEIDLLTERMATRELRALVVRVAQGAKAELLPLLTLRGVGRVRGRALFSAGFRSLRDLRGASPERIERVPGVGPALARSIRAQVETEASAEATGPAAEEPADHGEGGGDAAAAAEGSAVETLEKVEPAGAPPEVQNPGVPSGEPRTAAEARDDAVPREGAQGPPLETRSSAPRGPATSPGSAPRGVDSPFQTAWELSLQEKERPSVSLGESDPGKGGSERAPPKRRSTPRRRDS